ncbi:MAG: thiamine phosphate synthase [Succinivibrionaceae bacterium]|nr:thiamine phosphate synthase [Succinivibrionaceae bacterium]
MSGQEFQERARVLAFAGVDSGGGAGISADMLTISDHGAWGLLCPTALTAQSLSAVAGVSPVGDDFFSLTLRTVREGFPGIAAIKVGLVTEASHLELILDALERDFPGVPVVWDPVLNATAGRLESADLKSALPRILRASAIFTPNLPEALELLGEDPRGTGRADPRELARAFLGMGARCVIIKGGHVDGADLATDTFASAGLTFTMSSPKPNAEGAHGGGCALSSALAALLAQGYAPHDAAVLAKAYVTQGILEADVHGGRRPPLAHHGMVRSIDFLPAIEEEGFPHGLGRDFPACPPRLGLYPVLPDCGLLEAALRGGARTAQLRLKDASDPRLPGEVARAVALGKEYRAHVFIDDHYDLAIKAGAYGVHLGMEDLREADLGAILRAGLRLGVSTHGAYELCKALALRPSYIALGHIFPTTTKVMPSKPQGLARLAHEVRMIAGRFPTVAIGGIDRGILPRVVETGVGSVAVVRAVTQAADPVAATRDLLSLCTAIEGD